LATGFKLSDPREYRRGVVLGLTLAEVLVLLVFLLLLSMAALLLRKEREQGVLLHKLDYYTTLLQPLTKALASRGIVVADTDGLASLIRRGSEAEGLRTQLQETRRQLDDAQSAAAQGARFAAENASLAAVLERVPGSAAQPLHEKLERIVQRAAAADASNASIVGQNNQMRVELERLKGNGGSGLPYCWAFPDGKAQYMLKVEMQDNGVIVRDIEPRARPQDPAWLLLDSVARGQLMPLAGFMSQVAPLQAKASADRCRHAIQVLDATGRTNKPGYKQSMGRLWTAFNVHEVSQ
jgi:hypothetical protein